MSSTDIFGIALADYFAGNDKSELIMQTDGCLPQILPVNVFFREADALSMDKIALSLCEGRILDVGAGSGEHSLYLQNRGYDITALDNSNESCRIMKARGVKNVLCADILNYHLIEKFKTWLILGRSIGAVGDLNGFRIFLKAAKNGLTEDGQIILNSINEPSIDTCRTRQLRFEFNGIKGDLVPWFDLGEHLLQTISYEEGFLVEVVNRDENHNYLAVLKVRDLLTGQKDMSTHKKARCAVRQKY